MAHRSRFIASFAFLALGAIALGLLLGTASVGVARAATTITDDVDVVEPTPAPGRTATADAEAAKKPYTKSQCMAKSGAYIMAYATYQVELDTSLVSAQLWLKISNNIKADYYGGGCGQFGAIDA